MQILLITLFILPFFYKTFFWLYTIQLKDYRWDRFREYIFTPQWKRALFNFWFLIETPILLFTLLIYSNYNLEWVIFKMLFYLFILENIFVIGKIFRKKVFAPTFTTRTNLILITLLIIVWFIIYFSFFYPIFYFLILFTFVWTHFLILISNIILLPIVDYKKKKIINKAILKSKKYSKPIKIWITGSFWKSSVKEFLSFILSKEANTLKTPKNINSELWVSNFIINNLNNNFKYFVAELWAYKVWEIKLLWKIVNHKYWFLTWIWNQHLWLFWNIENTIKWKSEIIKKVIKNNWILYINYDNKNIQKIIFPKNLKYIKYWIEWKNLDAKSQIIKLKNWKTVFDFTYKNIKTKFKTYLLWKHNIVNLTWVIAFCIDLWIKIENLENYIKELEPIRNTLKIIEIDGNFIIDDSYNLSEDWLFAWIEVLSSFNWNKILVLDDIIELWKDSKKIHFEIWERIGNSWLVDKILYAWVNYEKDFLYWLSKSWFNFDNLITDLEDIKPWDVILLEWKWSKKFFN